MTQKHEEADETSMVTFENERLDKRLKDDRKSFLTASDINTILLNVINRKRFSYGIHEIKQYLFNCLCLRKLKPRRWKSRDYWSSKVKKHY